MTKLITLMLLVIFIFGVGVYVFNGNNGGIVKTIQDGDTSITIKVRSNDYITN